MIDRFIARRVAAGVALALAVLLLLVLVAIFIKAGQPDIKVFSETVGSAQLHVESSNARVLLESDCFDVRWQFDGIRAVTLNDVPTVGVGEQQICGENAEFRIEFQDGDRDTFGFSRAILLGEGLLWQLPILAAAEFLAAGMLLGAPRWRLPRTWAWGSRPDVAADIARGGVLWLVVGVVLIGAVVRLQYIDIPIRGDEAWTFTEYASHPLAEALSRYESTNNHLLHTLLQHVSYRIFGDDLFGLRLPAFLVSLLVIAAAYRAGADLYGRRVGLLTAVFVSVMSQSIEFAVNARGYGLLVLSVLLLLSVGQRALRSNRRSLWLAFGVLAALGFYAQPIMLYPMGMIGVWLLANLLSLYDGVALRARLRGLALALGVGALSTLALYLPVILFLRAAGPGALDTESLSLGQSLIPYASNLNEHLGEIWRSLMRDVPPLMRLLLAAFAVVALVWHRRVALLPFSLALAALLWLTPLHYVQRAIFIWRSYIFLAPLLAMLSFAGLVWAVSRLFSDPRRRGGVVLLVGAVMMAVLLVAGREGAWVGNSYDVVPGGAAAAEYVTEHVDEFDGLLCRNPCYNVLRYLLGRNADLAAQTALSKLYVDFPAMPGGERLLVLVTIPGENVQMVVDRVDIDDSRYWPPTLLAELPQGGEAWLYERRD